MDFSKKMLQLLLIAAAGLAAFYVAMRARSPSFNQSGIDIVEAVTRTSTSAAIQTPESPTALERDDSLKLPPRARDIPDSKGDAFVAKSWTPPPPPPVRVAPLPPPPPPAPVAPPLPFTFVGLMEQGAAKPQAFLSKGDVLLVVAAGDLLDNNTYRVDTLTPQKIVITYLPLNTPQTLNILGTTK